MVKKVVEQTELTKEEVAVVNEYLAAKDAEKQEPVTTAAVSEVAEPQGRTRVYVLRSTVDTRYIEATSKTAAMLYVANALYSIDAASGKDLREAWKAGAQMESA